ncbi:Maf family protein [Calidifontibacillus oryziterrae]|uniref:Maf family protein n=1 Tax=Calidifontibacillus oryziterrae TaxID=1191699 RepID=UPI0002FC8B30|nr:Maf family protein [Calidifontibacillus oryziterrae]
MTRKLVLASGSPRRRELLANANITFEVVVSDIEEQFENNLTPGEIVQLLALQKAEDVAKRLIDDRVVVLGADTIVVLDEEVLGKPKDETEAKMMLKMLSGRVHTVYTGVALVASEQTNTFHEQTEVEFWELTDEEIDEYIRSGEPFDKAGAYGIQQLGSTLVKRINGDYFNVVGLPIARTVRELKKLASAHSENQHNN